VLLVNAITYKVYLYVMKCDTEIMYLSYQLKLNDYRNTFDHKENNKTTFCSVTLIYNCVTKLET